MRCVLPSLLFACASYGQLAAPNEAGVSIGHLHLIVENPEAQKKVWMEAMGATPTKSGTLEMLRMHGVFILIRKATEPVSGGTDGSMVHHLGFAVKDLTAMKARLEKAGVASAPVNGNPKQIMAQFPEKVIVELSEEADLPVPIAMHHIHLSTPDPEKLRAWYLATFGAKVGTRGNFLAAFVPGGEVDMRKASAPQAATKGRALDHIGFEVTGLEAFCKKLEAAGVKFERPYSDMPQIALKLAFLVDPEGTRIELTEGMRGK